MSSEVSPLPVARNQADNGNAHRASRFGRRHAPLGALILLWGMAAIALTLRGTDNAFPDPTRFALLETWLFGVGSVGCPMLPLRALGQHLTPYICVLMAAVLASAAVVLTVLMASGQMHPRPSTGTFVVLGLVTAAIQALNAADAEKRTRRREERARRQGRLEVLAEMYEQRSSALAALDQLPALSPRELEQLRDKIDAMLASPRPAKCATRLLHAVPETRGPVRVDPA